ncbi:MAG: aminodeoxychorismate/anthranilate synthase component II [Spirochaetia bacterium]|nr:aminodeoxychorismate/anthranilate synthase component II [Spirochaetia bacterium]
MKILIIDNYDSFTYNLYQYTGEILENHFPGSIPDVFRNDEISLAEIQAKSYDKIIISPGPGSPDDVRYFGVCSEVIREAGKHTPVLGVCLGMQGIAHCLGGKIKKARVPMHGKTSIISHDEKGVFKNLPQGLEVMRYHSLIVDVDSLPGELEITSRVHIPDSSDFEIMGLRHKSLPIEGIQFHPESFATEGGKKMLENFITGK